MIVENREEYAFGLMRILAVVMLLALVAGCAAKGPGFSAAELEAVKLMSTPELTAESEQAWNAKQFVRSELYYGRLVERSDLPPEIRPVATMRLAWSAYEAEHYLQSKTVLDKWAAEDPGVKGQWLWHELYIKDLSALRKYNELDNHLDWLLSDRDTPWKLKYWSAILVTRLYTDKGKEMQALDIPAGFYAQAPDEGARASFEQEFFKRIEEYDDGAVESLSRAAGGENRFRFPNVLVLFEQAKRQSVDEDEWNEAWKTMRMLVAEAEIVDKTFLGEILADLERTKGHPAVGVALALPLTGRYQDISKRIIRGAGVAQWKLANMGVEMELLVINTEARGWEERLDRLPPNFMIVGGPLRVGSFKRIQDKSVLSERAFFTFMPTLGEKEEGRDAWRFFSSPEDQVRALVDLSMSQLGVNSFAVLYPDEKFGKSMAGLFNEEVRSRGGQVAGVGVYPPGDHPQWGKSVAKLLKVPANFRDNKDIPLPFPDFGAVFLPDGWSQAQLLVSNFFFYEGNQLIFLGPELWSRALDETTDIESNYFRLASCPGSWWPESPGADSLKADLVASGLGEPDFWVALGFDFVRFTSNLGPLERRWSPSEVNARISKAQNMEFSMAPLSWDSNGMAEQKLYLFTPTKEGKELTDSAKLNALKERATARREKRMQAYKQELKAKKKSGQ